MSGELLSGLTDEVKQLLLAPPVTEKKLLELSVRWTGLSPSQARIGRRLEAVRDHVGST
jgi:hypothetical protein